MENILLDKKKRNVKIVGEFVRETLAKQRILVGVLIIITSHLSQGGN